ncbi:hypothetical protein BT63DRAFT_426624 [Microthyrium microscopicum]|uniref:Granulins domain-containing protein n=1 Tax=Microthyrium microscopicum TaxID=703497 RepID=A0A6A6U660_9PEZI|nr:hypothetical protein BT63DRAFT_426624 [Microthyrium microscopicum]
MTPVLTQILFGTSSLLTVTHAESYLVGTIHDLQKRQLPVQGWALVEDACPSGTGTCGLRSCCPVGSFCDTDSFTNSNVCCPTRKVSFVFLHAPYLPPVQCHSNNSI